MKKLIKGIVEFRKNVQQDYREAFGRLALGQSPDALFIACSDSRVVPNTFASTNPGDLFVVRNVGNLIPSPSEEIENSESVALEFSLLTLKVSDVIVCGHSECGAMQALLKDAPDTKMKHLQNWLRHAKEALQKLNSGFVLDSSLSKHNQLSQINVLVQMEHINSYPIVQKLIQEGSLAVHGWWFDLANADVYAYDSSLKRFALIEDKESS